MSTVSSAASPASEPARSLSPGRLSDEFLARQSGRGSERAFAALYERYHQPLYRYCRSIVRNDADAQDVLQSTFTAALSALQRDRRNAPLRPWLYRIAHNEAVTVLRRRNRENGPELPDAGPQAVASAEDQAADRARWSTLMADLARLPERQRSALLLRELSGLSHEEIAITLGTGVGGAKQAIFEARQGLAELAEGRAMSCDEVRRRLSAGDRRVLRARRVSAHLRECRGCEAFAADIRARSSELRALAPVLPSAVAADLLSRSLRAASVHGGSGAAAGSAATAGAVGKVAGTALTWKAVTGVAVVAVTAAGVTGLRHVLHGTHAGAVPPALTGHRARGAATASRVRGAASSSATRHGASGSARHGGAQANGAARGKAHRPSVPAAAGAAALMPSAASNGIGRGAASHGSGATSSAYGGRGVGRSIARGQSATGHGRSVGQSHSSASGRGRSHHANQSGGSSTGSHVKPQGSGRSGVQLTVTTPSNSPLPHSTG